MLRRKWEALALADVPYRISEYYRLNERPLEYRDETDDKDWWAENLLQSTDKVYVLITFKYAVHRWKQIWVDNKIVPQWVLEVQEQRNDGPTAKNKEDSRTTG